MTDAVACVRKTAKARNRVNCMIDSGRSEGTSDVGERKAAILIRIMEADESRTFGLR
jgi:hypothetical protein